CDAAETADGRHRGAEFRNPICSPRLPWRAARARRSGGRCPRGRGGRSPACWRACCWSTEATRGAPEVAMTA
ncbi:MAG: hypothetical protein AVDCRST_MAG04-1070, partial [uncultured Acetobacteraceae bacterium]